MEQLGLLKDFLNVTLRFCVTLFLFCKQGIHSLEAESKLLLDNSHARWVASLLNYS